MSDAPGKGLFGWLGRQFGHIKKAVQTDPAKPGPKVVYRENRTEEQQLPDQPGMKFRRTVIDEVIVEGKMIEGRKPEATSQKPEEKTNSASQGGPSTAASILLALVFLLASGFWLPAS